MEHSDPFPTLQPAGLQHSDQLNELAGALAKAQSEMRNPAFDSVNPHFKSKFASLAGVRDTILPTLNRYALAVTQWPETRDGRVYVTTMLTHSSGQWIRSTFHVPAAKADAHGVGSSITYARRYALMACAGVVGDVDDDGNAAVAQPSKPGPAAAKPAPDAEALVQSVVDQIADAGDDVVRLRAVYRSAQEQCGGDVSLWNRIKVLFPQAKAA